jgi:hypothetical protein
VLDAVFDVRSQSFDLLVMLLGREHGADHPAQNRSQERGRRTKFLSADLVILQGRLYLLSKAWLSSRNLASRP